MLADHQQERRPVTHAELFGVAAPYDCVQGKPAPKLQKRRDEGGQKQTRSKSQFHGSNTPHFSRKMKYEGGV